MSKSGKCNETPAFLEKVQSHQDIIGLVANPRVQSLIEVILVGQGIVENKKYPLWVANAAREFWNGCMEFPKTKKGRNKDYQFGFLCGVLRNVPADTDYEDEKKIMQLLKTRELERICHTNLVDSPAEEARPFYEGFAAGMQRSLDFAPIASVKIYLVIAARWEEIATLKNVPAVQEWLEKIVGQNLTGNRDRLSKLLRKIQFPLMDKGGRPRTKPRKAK